MQSLAYGAVAPSHIPLNNPVVIRSGQDLLIKLGAKDLGYCSPARNGKGKQEGWLAFAYQVAPVGAAASVLETSRLKQAVAFVISEGVAL